MERKTGAIRKTGSTRKTTVVRRTERGTGPLVLAAALLGLWGEFVGFFSLYYGLRGNRPLLVFLFSALAPLAGLLVWNRLCKRNRWPFFTGADDEPYGIYAFVWGAVTFFPLIFCVRLLSTRADLDSVLAVLRWMGSREFALVPAYALAAGAAAVLFYGFRPGRSLRARLRRRPMERETFDLLSAGLWALILSAVPTLSLSLFAPEPSPRDALAANALGYAAPVSLAPAACLLALSGYFYFSDHRRLDPKGLLKGFLAELALRCALFWGTWLLVDGARLASLTRLLRGAMARPFDPMF